MNIRQAVTEGYSTRRKEEGAFPTGGKKMALDRRKTPRPGADRRTSDRLPDYRSVEWRTRGSRQHNSGTLVQWSREGVAILAEAEDTPRVGDRLTPRCRPDAPAWRRPVRVECVKSLRGGMHMVIARYADEADEAEGSPSGRRPLRAGGAMANPSRRPAHEHRPAHERRRSPRWRTDKVLNWRVHRGKKTRTSRLVLRSLDGFVLVTARHDSPREGARVHPATDKDRQRFGFHSALVKRVDRPDRDACLVYAEIEA